MHQRVEWGYTKSFICHIKKYFIGFVSCIIPAELFHSKCFKDWKNISSAIGSIKSLSENPKLTRSMSAYEWRGKVFSVDDQSAVFKC